MNELRVEIKQLMKQAGDFRGRRDESVPWGFTARVAAQARLTARPSLALLQRMFSIASWTAGGVIVVCSALLLQQPRPADPAAQVVAATQYLAETLSP